ncbi:MAG: hypothetical protein R3F62_02040 [Planctomycetota bacterium]
MRLNLALAFAVLLAGCQPQTLVAERIVLVNAAGEPQVYLGLDKTGTRRGLVVLDERGQVRAGLSLLGDDVELLLTDVQGQERARLWTAGEASGWSLRDPATGARLSARLEAGQAQVLGIDAQGEVVVHLPE